jgi:hypothetical protein
MEIETLLRRMTKRCHCLRFWALNNQTRFQLSSRKSLCNKTWSLTSWGPRRVHSKSVMSSPNFWMSNQLRRIWNGPRVFLITPTRVSISTKSIWKKERNNNLAANRLYLSRNKFGVRSGRL